MPCPRCGYNLRGNTRGATWFDAVASWPGRRIGLPLLLTLTCLSLRWLSRASELDGLIEHHWYRRAAAALWALTGAHALGVVWSLLARLPFFLG